MVTVQGKAMSASTDNKRADSGSTGSGGSTSSETAPSEIVDRVADDTAGDSMSMTSRYLTVAILFLVNLLNYMDRLTIAGVLDQVQTYYQVGDDKAGLLQAIFIVGYMIFSPIFGYCGDRYSRKYLMVGGIAFWSVVTLAGSFVPKQYFGVLVLLRGLVGVGEASYSTIAPTLISDMFVRSRRSYMLMIFYFAIPVGGGLGYIVGSSVASAAGHWYWALRVTPGLGIICCVLIMCVAKDPPRGMAEHAADAQSSSLWIDIKSLLRIKSFMLDTFGFVCVAFVSGALTLFGPKFVYHAYSSQEGNTMKESTVSLYFGILTCGSGFLGILLGSNLAYVVKKKYPGGDALVCAVGLIGSSIFLFFTILLLEYSINAAWGTMFIGMTLVCLNWSLAADIVLYTVIPTRRSTAEAMMIFIGHVLGDAGSPYLLGVLSVYLVDHKGLTEFRSLQYSLYTCTLVAMVGGGLFLACSLFIEKDRAKADAITQGASEQAAECILSSAQLDDDVPLLYA